VKNSEEHTKTLNPEQLAIFVKMWEFVNTKKSEDIFLLKGYAGTGKTYLITKFIKYYLTQKKFQNVALSAPTNKAVAVLKQSSDKKMEADFTTIHKLLGIKREITEEGREIFVQKKHPIIDNYRILIIDEVSMLDDELFDKVKQFSKRVKIILMGDPAQIPPVNSVDCIPFLEPEKHHIVTNSLMQIMRQKNGSGIIKNSFYIREHLRENIRSVEEGDKDVEVLSPTKDRDKIVRLFEKLAINKKYLADAYYTKIIAWRNKKVSEYNNHMRNLIYGVDAVAIVEGERLIFNTALVEMEMPIINTSQEVIVKSVGVDEDEFDDGATLRYYNCEVEWFDVDEDKDVTWEVKIIHEDSKRAYDRILNKKKVRAIKANGKMAKALWKQFFQFKEQFADVSYSYAITAHKSQGSTYKNVIVAMEDIIVNPNTVERNRILYTAFTRAKDKLIIINRFQN